MVHVIVLVDVAAGMAESAVEAIRKCAGVTEAHVVAGDFDIVVELDGEGLYDVRSTVTSDICEVEGVGTTRSYVCLD